MMITERWWGWKHYKILMKKNGIRNLSVLSEGDIIKVKLIGFDRGKMKLSKKVLEQ